MTKYKNLNGTSYPSKIPDSLIAKLEYYRETRTRLRIFYGNTATGHVWPEECEVQGRIGRTTGEIHAAILVHNERSCGGGTLLGDIVAIKISGTNTWIYKHENLYFGHFEIVGETVFHNGIMIAKFINAEKAQKYVAFMKGERDSK